MQNAECKMQKAECKMLNAERIKPQRGGILIAYQPKAYKLRRSVTINAA
jgi:hypothetical protein